MLYLPIIPILQRMFASMQTAPHMTWHHENQSQGMQPYPYDGEAWKHFDIAVVGRSNYHYFSNFSIAS